MSETLRVSTNYPASTSVGEFRSFLDEVDHLHYDGLTVSDQALRRNTYAWSALAADRTSGVWIGPAVTNPYSRNPGLTAASIATLDELSGGRAVLGMGIGGHGVGPFGYDQSRPIGAVREAIEVINRLLAGETVTHDAREFSLHDAALEFDPPRSRVPVYIGGRGPQLLSLAGAVADGVFAGGGLTSPEGLAYAFERVRIGAEAAGRDPDDVDIRVMASICLAEDRDVAIDAVTRHVATRVTHQANADALVAGGADPEHIERVRSLDLASTSDRRLRSAVPTELLEQFVIAGTPEDALDRVERLIDAGVTDMTIVARANPELGRAAMLRRFSDRVLDRFA